MKGLNRKSSGSVVELLTAGICVIAMSIMVMAYLNSVQLINKRAEVSQLARKYILRMETVGFLQGADRERMVLELDGMGVKNVNIGGTTVNEVDYGNPITLIIQGTIQGKETASSSDFFSFAFRDKGFAFYEKRMTTAKN